MKATELAALLASRAEETCRHLLPNGARKGKDWCCGSLSGEAGGSLKIALTGAKAGVWADFADNGSSGDLIGLWQRVRGIDLAHACQQAEAFLGVTPTTLPPLAKRIETKAPSDTWLRLQERLRPGTDEELDALAALRGIPSVAGLELATAAGHLWFADVWDDGFDHAAWIITDGARRNAQARRMDGQLWAGISAKAKTIAGCEAAWPVGIHGANGKDVVLVEGGPDLLAAWHCIWLRGLADTLTPAAMLGASQSIHADALPLLASRHIFIVPHDDEAGAKAAAKWSAQLTNATPQTVTLPTKDLNDFVAADVDASTLFTPELETMDLGDDTPATNPANGRPLGDFNLPPPSDPSILIGNRWLSRGDIAILASTSGMGKSSLAIQAAVTWGLGRKLFDGFDPHRPLKSLIIQAEDGDGDIAEVRLSLEHAMALTPEDKALVNQNVIIVTDRTHRGLTFRAELKRLLALHKPDLVWINPLLAFIGGDVNDSTDVGTFLREQLNSLNEPPTFAYIIVHHTAKPPKERKERQWNEVMYEMAGSADLTNAARAILSLQASGTEGTFKLIAAKRGQRAGLTNLVPGTINTNLKFEQPTSIIMVRHSKEKFTPLDTAQELPVIHWERCEQDAEEFQKQSGGRPPKYGIKDIEKWLPREAAKAKPPQQIYREAEPYVEFSKTAAKGILIRAAAAGHISTVDRSGIGPCYYITEGMNGADAH